MIISNASRVSLQVNSSRTTWNKQSIWFRILAITSYYEDSAIHPHDGKSSAATGVYVENIQMFKQRIYRCLGRKYLCFPVPSLVEMKFKFKNESAEMDTKKSCPDRPILIFQYIILSCLFFNGGGFSLKWTFTRSFSWSVLCACCRGELIRNQRKELSVSLIFYTVSEPPARQSSWTWKLPP